MLGSNMLLAAVSGSSTIRVTLLLTTSLWIHGMDAQVKIYVSLCRVGGYMLSSYNRHGPTLVGFITRGYCACQLRSRVDVRSESTRQDGAWIGTCTYMV